MQSSHFINCLEKLTGILLNKNKDVSVRQQEFRNALKNSLKKNEIERIELFTLINMLTQAKVDSASPLHILWLAADFFNRYNQQSEFATAANISIRDIQQCCDKKKDSLASYQELTASICRTILYY